MFTFVGGPYTDGITTITAATMNYLRGTAVPNAWDIIGGGTYTPTSKTTVDGAIGLRTNFSAVGLEVAGLGGLHIITGSTGYIDAGGAFVANGTATFNAAVTVSATGAITTNAASTTTLNGPLAQVGGATFSSTAVFNGAASIGAAGTFATNAAATSTFNGPITAANTISLTASQPASTADTGANVAYSTHMAKAWGKITTNGAGAVTVDDGLNIASVAVSATVVTITFAHAFANANYAATVTGTGIGQFVIGAFGVANTTTLEIYLWEVVGAAAVNPSTQAVVFHVHVFGRQ